MKNIFILFVCLAACKIGKGQDYYIYKRIDKNSENYEKLRKDKKTLDEKAKRGSDSEVVISIEELNSQKMEQKSLKKGINRILFNDSTRVQTVQLAFGRGDINGQLYSNLINDVFVSKRDNYLGEISLGSVVSNTTASDSSENQKSSNINNFFNGGGNVFIKYAYLLPFGYPDGYDNFTFLFAPSIRAASNLPKLSENERLESWNIELATELTVSLNGRNNK